MKEEHLSAAAYDLAVNVGKRFADDEFQAQSVRYVADRDAVEIVTARNAGFLIPRQWIAPLRDIAMKDLARLKIWPDGSAIEIDDLDIHISVHGLLAKFLPEMLPARSLAAIFASRGGEATSDAKRSAARANGRKGGRPRKGAAPEAAE